MKFGFRPCACAVILLFAAALFPACSRAAQSNLIDYQKWTSVGSPGQIAMAVVEALGTDREIHHIVRVTVLKPTVPYYYLQITQPLRTSVPADRRVAYSFWAKSTNHNFVRACIELDRPPYTGYVATTIVVPSTWTKYSVVDTSPGIPANTAAVRLQVGKQTGTIEFADVRVLDIGIDPDYTAALAAIKPAAVQARIRRFRMAYLTVHVADTHGRPISGAIVTIKQTSHAFLFGCNIFGLSQTDPDTQLQDKYRSEFAALFNYATLPFYWNSFEPKPGNMQFARLQWMAQWCAKHGIATKAHPLVWNRSYPSWAPLDVDQTIALLHRRVTDIVARMSPVTKYYDVVNEAAGGAAAQQPPVGESNWVLRDGAAKVVATALGWARAAGRGEGDTFVDNDYDIGQNNVALMKALQKTGDLPDAIGIQSHMHTGVWPMTKVWMVCDRFGQFHRPIHFTEITALSTNTPHAVDPNAPPSTDWPTTPAGEKSQAAYVAKFYSLLFSYPQMRAITWWDFSDRNSWMGAPSGLVRADMSPKPAYGVLMNLIHNKWWTNASLRTDKRGNARVRVFYGSYDLSARSPSGQARSTTFLPESSGPKSVTLTIAAPTSPARP